MELQICDSQASCHITIQSTLSWRSFGSFPMGLTSWLPSRQPQHPSSGPVAILLAGSSLLLQRCPSVQDFLSPSASVLMCLFPTLARGRCLPDFPDHTSFGLTQRYFFKLASVCETNGVPHACQTLRIASS